jgi:hypothetical protein
MFGSQILEVAIGLVLLFLLLSLICSSIKEGVESFMKYRARDLESGLREIFNDPDGKTMIPKFYSHPLIYGLFKGRFDPHDLGKLPSYIPSQTFAHAVLDLYKQEPENEQLKRVLTPLLQAAGADFRRAQANVEEWYNGAMDRVSGWYKRRTQKVIAVLGFAIAFGLNIDCIAIARYLNVTPASRSALMDQASKVAPSGTNPFDTLSTVVHVGDIPIGWTTNKRPLDSSLAWRAFPTGFGDWLLKIAGLLATSLAISLGAPFWFDVLNKFMVVRSTVKPEEKSRAETSKD